MKNGRARLSEEIGKKSCIDCAMTQLICPQCYEINFADMADNGVLKCTVCRRKYPVPFKAYVNGFEIIAGTGKVLSEYHIGYGSDTNRGGIFCRK